MKEQILEALLAKYNGDIQHHKANIDIYLKNPTGIGEHPDVLAAIDNEMSKMTEAEEKRDSLLASWWEAREI